MKPQELKIGNWINYRGDVCPIDLQDFKMMIEHPAGHDSWKPISLTEEWLEKFGFEQHPWGWVNQIRLTNKSYIYQTDNGDNVKITYVHQLQNLFYVLTGKELEVTDLPSTKEEIQAATTEVTATKDFPSFK